MRKPLIITTALASLFLSSCTDLANRMPGVYSLDIQQGNIFSQEAVDQLRPNMNKRQVLYIMGSPMLKDIFHQKRWDYIYSDQPGGKPRLQKRISLFFEDEKLIGVQGDFRPSSVPVIGASKEVTVDVPKREKQKTLLEKIGGIFTSEDDNMPEIPDQINIDPEAKEINPDELSKTIEEAAVDATDPDKQSLEDRPIPKLVNSDETPSNQTITEQAPDLLENSAATNSTPPTEE